MLRYHSVGEPAGGQGLQATSTSAPVPGTAEEGRMMNKHARRAVDEHKRRTRELEAALEENRLALEKLTAADDDSDEELLEVARERKYLKQQLKLRKAADAEAPFEVRGRQWSFEVTLGERVHLEGLPGRPSVVWAMAADSDEQQGQRQRSVCTDWQTRHSVSVSGAAAASGSQICSPFILCSSASW